MCHLNGPFIRQRRDHLDCDARSQRKFHTLVVVWTTIIKNAPKLQNSVAVLVRRSLHFSLPHRASEREIKRKNKRQINFMASTAAFDKRNKKPIHKWWITLKLSVFMRMSIFSQFFLFSFSFSVLIHLFFHFLYFLFFVFREFVIAVCFGTMSIFSSLLYGRKVENAQQQQQKKMKWQKQNENEQQQQMHSQRSNNKVFEPSDASQITIYIYIVYCHTR